MHSSIWKPRRHSGLLVVISLCLLQSGVGVARAEVGDAGSPPHRAIYDANPNHLWNRLFAAFYERRIVYNAVAPTDKIAPWNRVLEPEWVGPDVLDPPLGYHPKYLLDDEPFTKCTALPDEFSEQHGEELIRDPLKRAMMQRDLWAVFDVLAQAGHPTSIPMGSMELSFRLHHVSFTNPPPLSPALEERRMILERKLARAIRLLALSRAEIERLPDTYRAAMNSGAFTGVLQSNVFNYLPPDLFVTNSGWHEIVPVRSISRNVPGLLEHAVVEGGRSLFRSFVKPLENPRRTNVLADYLEDDARYERDSERNQKEWEQFWATNNITRSDVVAIMARPEEWQEFSRTNPEAAENLNPKPVRHGVFLRWGTQFVLLREMICLDVDGQMVPSHVVESVQFHMVWWSGGRSDPGQMAFREAELSRALLFQGRQGGLRPILKGDERVRAYNSLGHLATDVDGNGPPRESFPANCGECHASNSTLFSPVAAFPLATRSDSIEALARWKEDGGKLNLLREMMTGRADNP